jgi:hypothetical protein
MSIEPIYDDDDEPGSATATLIVGLAVLGLIIAALLAWRLL